MLGYPVCILLESCILICFIWISVFWCFSWNSVFWCFSWNSGKTRRVCQRCSLIPTNPGPWENLAQKSDRSKVESHHHCISQSKYFALLHPSTKNTVFCSWCCLLTTLQKKADKQEIDTATLKSSLRTIQDLSQAIHKLWWRKKEPEEAYNTYKIYISIHLIDVIL